MTELVGLPYSPWSEKARWALEARHIQYRSTVYQPLVGEPAMRFRTGRWTGNVSVPVLFPDAGRAIPDSLDIARWADRPEAGGSGELLFPPDLAPEISRLVEVSERALDAGRCLSLYRMIASDDALREMVPRGLRAALGPIGPRVAAVGIRRTLRKYGAGRVDRKTHEDNLVKALEELRAALASPRATGEPKTLLGRFTFADISATQALGFVHPPSFGIRIGAASRKTFTDEALRERFADVIAWRDAVYERYRPRS